LFHVFNGVRGLDIESDGLASQSFDENLHDEIAVVVVVLECPIGRK
jgi:hypothetical protein